MSEQKEPSRLIQPGQIQVPLTRQVVKAGATLQINLQTPEGRKIIVLIQPVDYNWYTDEFLINVGQLDLNQAALEGKIPTLPKGIMK